MMDFSWADGIAHVIAADEKCFLFEYSDGVDGALAVMICFILWNISKVRVPLLS